MKKIAFLILIVAFLVQGNNNLFAQANTQKIGSPNVTSIVLGGLQADSALKVPFLPKTYNYTKGQTKTGQLILATGDTALYLNKGAVQVQIFDQSDTNTTYGPTTPFYVNKQINKIINDSTLAVKVVGYGLDRLDTILLVDSTVILNIDKSDRENVKYVGSNKNVDLGVNTITTRAALTDTVQAKPGQNLHLHGSGGTGIRIGGTAGANITFDSYATAVFGDSVLATDSTGRARRYNMKAKLALYPLYTDTALSVTIPSSYQLDSAKRNIRSTIAAGSVSAVTSASNGQMLYKLGDTLKGAANIGSDTTDGRLVLRQSATTQPSASSLGVKVYYDKYLGYGELGIIDTADIYTMTQRSLGYTQFGIMQPSTTSAISLLGTYVTNMVVFSTALTCSTASYNASLALPNYTRSIISSAATSSSPALLRINNPNGASGILVGNSKLIGGGRYTFRGGVPNYNVGHRYFFGIMETLGQTVPNADPSSYSNIIGLAKDVSDTTWQIIQNNNSGSALKVNTGLTPNSSYAYRLTITVPSRGTPIYVILDEITSPNNVNTYRYVLSTDLPTQVRLYSTAFGSTAATSILTSIAVIETSEEIH